MKKLIGTLLVAGAISLCLPIGQSYAGDYTSKVATPWVLVMDGVSFGTFSAGTYRWAIPLDNNPGGVAMYQTALAAFQSNRNIAVGCQICRQNNLAKYPVSGNPQFWVPEYVMMLSY